LATASFPRFWSCSSSSSSSSSNPIAPLTSKARTLDDEDDDDNDDDPGISGPPTPEVMLARLRQEAGRSRRSSWRRAH